MPYRTDPEAAKKTSFMRLVAAGYQTAAVTFGLFAATGALAESGGFSRRRQPALEKAGKGRRHVKGYRQYFGIVACG